MNEHDSDGMKTPLSGGASPSCATLAEAQERIAELEAELSGKRGEVEALRAARVRDAAALAERDQELAELESLREQSEDWDAQLSVQRLRGDELAGLLATERSWGDELERLLRAARARGEELERALADQRDLVLAHEVGEAEEPGDGDAASEAEAAPVAGVDREPEPQPGVDALDRAQTSPDAGGAPEPVPAAAGAGAPRWSHGAQLTLTAAQAGCPSWGSVLNATVRIVGSEGGWDAVIAWVLDKRDTRYTCRAAWCRAPDQMARFETSMWQVRQAASGSCIGDAASAVEPEWLRGLDGATDPHLASVTQAGIKTLGLLPVRHGLETIAVLELCARAELEPDPELNIALQVIAAGLASVHQLLSAAQTPRWTSGHHRL